MALALGYFAYDKFVLSSERESAGDQIRITAQLIKADDGYHMWSETFDRKLENVFAIQDEIAAEQ